MRVLLRIVLVSLMVLGFSTPAEAAARGGPERRLLGQLWHEVFTIPTTDNPFSPTGSPCVNLHGAVSVFGANADGAVCKIHRGTRLLIVGYSSECSTLEDPPFGVPAGQPVNKATLRTCAQAADAGFDTPQVTLDGRSLALTRITSRLIKAKLPKDNVFGTTERRIKSVADGWVVVASKLSVGRHAIVVTVTGTGTDGKPVNTVTTSTVVVGHQH